MLLFANNLLRNTGFNFPLIKMILDRILLLKSYLTLYFIRNMLITYILFLMILKLPIAHENFSSNIITLKMTP